MFRFRSGIAFAVACVGFVVGVGSGAWNVFWWGILGVVIVLGVLMVQIKMGIADERRRKKDGRQQRKSEGVWFLLFFVAFFFFGSWRYQDIQPTAQSIAMIANGEVHDLEGTIVRIAESEKGMRFTLDRVSVGGEVRENRVLVRTSLFAEHVVGERIRISCPLERPEPFDDFAYDRYLAAKDIVATCSSRSLPFFLGIDERIWIRFLAAIDTIHRGAIHAIDVVLPDPHAQLLAGLLLGDDAFSDTWQERFLRTGTSHIVAASGSNVALVVSLVLGLFFAAGIHRRYATIFVFFGIGVFVVLAGGESAVLRAGIMASLLVFVRFIGRASSVRNVILFTVCVMLFFEPRILRDDVGFQLSVLSTIGLIFWAKLFAKNMIFIPETFGLREGFATTLAATLATLPVTLFGMGQISFVGPLANLLVLPLLPFAMASGAIATVVGMVWPLLGRVVVFPAWWILDTVLMVLRELSTLSFVYAKVSLIGVLWVVGVGLVFLGVWRIGRMVNGYLFFRHAGLDPASSASRNDGSRIGVRDDKGIHTNQKISFLVPFIFISLFLLSFSQHVLRDGWFSSDVRVWVFDVGQGDAIFIDTPEKDVMIDGGSASIVREKVGIILPWFDRNIEDVFVTHPHADHIAGLVPLLEQYSADIVGESDQGCSSLECFAFGDVVALPTVVQSGDIFNLALGVTLRAVWPQRFYDGKKISDPNDGSLVFLLETPHGSMLLTGDAGIEEEYAFLELLPGHVDVLKVGHHGSRTSTSDELLEALHPGYAIISLGEGNSFEHPHEEVIERLEKYGVEIYRTDISGDIKIEFGKGGVFVSAWNL